MQAWERNLERQSWALLIGKLVDLVPYVSKLIWDQVSDSVGLKLCNFGLVRVVNTERHSLPDFGSDRHVQFSQSIHDSQIHLLKLCEGSSQVLRWVLELDGCFWLREEVVHGGELSILDGLSFPLSFEDVADFQVLQALLKIFSLGLFDPDDELGLQRRWVRLVCLKHWRLTSI